MSDDYLSELTAKYKALEKAGFTEDQIEALIRYVEFKNKGVIGYIKDIELHDMKVEIDKTLRIHRHIDGVVHIPLKYKNL